MDYKERKRLRDKGRIRRGTFEARRNSHLMTKYGITLERYNELSEAQNHVCAICGNAETRVIHGTLTSLCVDHCHQSGKVRGLLCANCNRAIGLIKDNTELLKNAVRYLGGA
ncbi:endonuclease VII domain-containing protein [Salmonella enterica]|nr:endonuclease VII domain-containing protein [Salmonella enterica]